MKIVPTSNGLEWNSDGSAFLDAIPAAGPGRQPVNLAEVVAASKKMVWQNWTPAMSPTHDLRTFTGVIGIHYGANVLLRFIYKRSTNPLDALYTIESLDRLPGALAGCLCAAVTATPLPQPIGHLNGIPSIFARYNDSGTDLQRPAKRLNRKELEMLVAGHINALINHTEPKLPEGAVNRARFWIELSAALWKADNLRHLGAVTNMTELRHYNELAVLWLGMRSNLTYRVGKQEVHPQNLQSGSPWSEALVWSETQIPAEAIRFFNSFRVTDNSWIAMQTTPDIDMQHADAVAAGLLHEAQSRQAYTALGQFVLALPDHLPWRESAIRAFAIFAQPQGLWVAGLTAKNERTASFQWSPLLRSAANLRQHTLGENPLAHATLAAFWHDLVIAGDEVIITRERPSSFPSQRSIPVTTEPDAGTRKPPTITLPRRSVHLTGSREWSSAADREIITRQSHGVHGHLRQLPPTWRRSEQAEREAHAWGFVLPDGYTFVRPHIRGDHDRDPAPVVAKARGLQTISTLL